MTDTVRAAQGIDLSSLASKIDLLGLEARWFKWSIGLAIGQIAVIAALVKLL